MIMAGDLITFAPTMMMGGGVRRGSSNSSIVLTTLISRLGLKVFVVVTRPWLLELKWPWNIDHFKFLLVSVSWLCTRGVCVCVCVSRLSERTVSHCFPIVNQPTWSRGAVIINIKAVENGGVAFFLPLLSPLNTVPSHLKIFFLSRPRLIPQTTG